MYDPCIYQDQVVFQLLEGNNPLCSLKLKQVQKPGMRTPRSITFLQMLDL